MWGTPLKVALQNYFPRENLAGILWLTSLFPMQTVKVSGLSGDEQTGHRIVGQSERAPVVAGNKTGEVAKAGQSLWHTFFLCSLNNCCHQPFFFLKC